ncbi:MAG: hypothetical protein Q4D29_12855 [Lachnospiraceae bacterium]|nr:hypothetical protein [Lachnospiraceae bacterium]
MGDVVLREDNLLWFVDESTGLMEYKEGGLANQIFDIVDRKLLEEQQVIMQSILNSSPVIAEMANGMKKTERLQLVLSDEVKEKIAKGTYKLMKNKSADGVFKAVVVDKKGTIKAIADLKWEEVGENITPAGLASAMQGMAVQQQLRSISEKLQDMSVAMEDVLIGQHNDRLAMFLSGEAIYREALSVTDEDVKKNLTTSAIMALTNATSSLQASLIHEINTICEGYNEEKGRFVGIKSEKLKEKMFIINSSFQAIHKAATLKAAIYYKEGEYSALTTVLDDYKNFLERTLPDEKAHILYLADPNEKTFEGVWDIRKNELPSRIEKTRELLVKPHEYVLEMSKGEIA